MLTAVIVTSTATQLLALSTHLEAAGVLRTVGHAVFVIFAVVFVFGGLIGFFIGRATGRR
jgi:hypothetical protein